MRWLHWWHCVSFCSLFKPKANICIVTMLRSSFPLPLIRLLERILLILCAVDFNDFISQPAERWFKPIIRINNRFSCFRCYNMIWNRTFQLWNSQCQNHLDSINFGSFVGQFIKSIQKKPIPHDNSDQLWKSPPFLCFCFLVTKSFRTGWVVHETCIK